MFKTTLSENSIPLLPLHLPENPRFSLKELLAWAPSCIPTPLKRTRDEEVKASARRRTLLASKLSAISL